MSGVTPDLVRTLMTDAQAVTVFDALSAAGVDALLLKGRSTRALLYAGGERPPSSDVDVLVAPDRVRAAEAVLARLGYVGPYDGPAPATAAHHADPWRHPGTGEAVDLHRRVWGVGADPSLAWTVLWAGRATVAHGTAELAALSVPGRALALALHVAHHVGQDGVGRAEADLARGIERLDTDVWRAALALARELDAERGLAAGLRGAVALRAELGLGEVDAEPQVDPSLLATLATEWRAQTWAGRGRLVRRQLFPSRAYMDLHERDRGRPDPRGARLALAYLRRLHHLAVLTPRDLRRARR